MTNFEIITKSKKNLSEFLYSVQTDALDAEGCSVKLTMPPQGYIDFEAWLNEEAENNEVQLKPYGVIWG